MRCEEIAYQNKDITIKVLAENFKGKPFRVYGLDLPGDQGGDRNDTGGDDI
jgi:hypothetical protein